MCPAPDPEDGAAMASSTPLATPSGRDAAHGRDELGLLADEELGEREVEAEVEARHGLRVPLEDDVGRLLVVRGLADELAGQRVAVILHDSGTRYLDTIFDDAWVAHKLGLSPADIRRMIDDIDA